MTVQLTQYHNLWS